MAKFYFAIGLHFHQPVGNFDRILERAYLNCYKPFLEVFTKYPDVKITFHFSGNLLDYFEERHPEFLDRVKELVDRGRIEIMGGGYYEPIFQAIPEKDRVGQIEMLSNYSGKRFHTRPTGMWIPERVWSPDLIADFRSCGIRYSILDDTHLVKAGINENDLYGYFMAGHNDERIAIFPIKKILRYIIPFKSPRKIIDYFKEISKDREDSLLTYGDDGEKFGEWPWTHDWIYKKGWLNNFFKELVKSQRWLEIVTFSEYLDSHLPLKDIQIPEASYSEMLEWSGGSWMNFLSKYPESNQMHKRMMYVSKRIGRLERQNIDALEQREKLEAARRELYKGQCNCPYWHGVFGGIYLHHLRNAVYEHLINADKIIDEIEYKDKNGWMNIKETDFYDRDRRALIFENKNFFICIDSALGGIIRELDYKKESANLINTLARRKEAYHKKILEKIINRFTEPLEIYEAIKTMDTRIKRGIFYDKHLRSCLVDHFINKDLEILDFADCNYIDMGDFVDAPYLAKIEKEKTILTREGKVKGKTVSIAKEIYISSDNEIEIAYSLKNKDTAAIDTFFGIEFNITMPYADSERYSYEADRTRLGGLDKRDSISRASSFSIKDSQGRLGIELMFSERPDKIWYFPLSTISQSERSYDFNYQSSCIFPIWHIELFKGEEISFSIKWAIH